MDSQKVCVRLLWMMPHGHIMAVLCSSFSGLKMPKTFTLNCQSFNSQQHQFHTIEVKLNEKKYLGKLVSPR